jgi:ABC-type transport system substrate-binding protein
VATLPDALLAIRAEWKQIGVKVDLRVVDFATWRDLNFTRKDFDVFTTGPAH